ncbi:MAG: hypothetical protein A3J75_00095 [Acidobacteria bacterium RBG_16_68_9]|nr:MAG: hypothetical protein A3J75_00095 [Acidobacteria bacterium RBG_16_68_9]
MSVFLRITAGLSLCWAVMLLVFTPTVLAHLVDERLAVSLASSLAISHVGLAFAFWRGARNPSAERTVIYAALLVVGLRAAKSTYETLYVLEGRPAVLSLIEMVTCIALFVAILNALPEALRPASTDEQQRAAATR